MIWWFICIGLVINQVSSRCLITAETAGFIDVINVDDFAAPLLVHSFPIPSSNSMAFDSYNERLYLGVITNNAIHSLNMFDICLSISTNSTSVPSTFIGNSATSNFGLAYDSTENRLYSGYTNSLARTNPVNGDSTVITWTGVSVNNLLESFDPWSEGLYYLNANWNKISNYREPSTSVSSTAEFGSTISGPITGLTWLNANEVLVYNAQGDLYTLNINLQTSGQVGNLNGIRPSIRGIHLFPDLSCTNLCTRCPSGCELDIADAQTATDLAQISADAAQISAGSAQTDATQALANAANAMQEIERLNRELSDAQTDATQALADAAKAMQEIERLSRKLSDSDSDEGFERAFVEDEKHIDNSKLNDVYDDEKHITIDVSVEIVVVICIVLFFNLLCLYASWKKET